ncbi:hypothetical protein WDW89_02815 [Deltaproteobacteria bacterium TL4]
MHIQNIVHLAMETIYHDEVQQKTAKEEIKKILNGQISYVEQHIHNTYNQYAARLLLDKVNDNPSFSLEDYYSYQRELVELGVNDMETKKSVVSDELLSSIKTVKPLSSTEIDKYIEILENIIEMVFAKMN